MGGRLLLNFTSDSATKEKIFHASLSNFNSKGYSGTTIREIAKTAKVNVSTIFYYFQDKKGLLEYCFIQFFEQYLSFFENVIQLNKEMDMTTSLKAVIDRLMDYQFDNPHLARFVWREISVDSQIVRETMTTYFRKERYLFQTIIEKGIKNGEFHKVSAGIAIIQLKGMMTMPFLNPIYTSEVWNIYFHDRYYLTKYKEQLWKWVDFYLCNDSATRVKGPVVR